MTSISVARVVKADPDRVWTVFTDLPRATERLSGVVEIEMLTETEFGEGTRWRETRQMFGRSATEEMWVSAVAPQEFYTVEADSAGTHYTSTYRFAPHPDGTEVTFEFQADVQGTMARILAMATRWIANGMVEKQLRADLDDLADACEQPV